MCFEECCGAPGAFLDAVLLWTICAKEPKNIRTKVGSCAYWVLILYACTLLGFALYYIIALWVYIATSFNGPGIAPLGGPTIGFALGWGFQILSLVWSGCRRADRQTEDRERLEGLLANAAQANNAPPRPAPAPRPAVVGQAVAPEPDAAAKILQLKRLLEAGAISQDEFDQKKQDLLCQI